MRPAGAARSGRLALAIAGGIALLAVAAWIVSRPAASDPRELAARTDDRPAPPAAAPAPPAATVATVSPVELPAAMSATDADESARLDRAVDVAIAALLRDLAEPGWYRGRWDDELGALAGGLPDGASERIALRLRDPATDAATRLVAAELLRTCGGERDELIASACLATLRRVALDGGDDASLSQVAARSLAWLGEEDDLARLSALLVRPRSETQRMAAGWALRVAPCAPLVPVLVRQLRSCTEGARDDRAADATLIALDDALHRRKRGSLPPEATVATVELLSRLLAEPQSSEPTRLRALAAGAALAARDDSARGAELLDACVTDEGAPVGRRLRAAELLLRLPRESAPAAQRAALDHLLSVARGGANAADRRSAWSALAAADRAAIGAELVRIEQAEPDAAVREVAARTLAQLR